MERTAKVPTGSNEVLPAAAKSRMSSDFYAKYGMKFALLRKTQIINLDFLRSTRQAAGLECRVFHPGPASCGSFIAFIQP